MNVFDDFTRKVLRQAIRHFKFVTSIREQGNSLVFSLENFGEEVIITRNADSYLFVYTSPTGDKAKSQMCDCKELTLGKLQQILGILLYV